MSLAEFPEKILIGKNFDPIKDLDKLFDALVQAEAIFNTISTQSSKVHIYIWNYSQNCHIFNFGLNGTEFKIQ